MPKIRLIVEDINDIQAALLEREMSLIPGVKVTVSVDPGPAIGEHLTDIDADELPEDILARIRYDAALLVGRIAHLEAQLQAEGAHTEAANAEIDRLKQPNYTTECLDPTSHPD